MKKHLKGTKSVNVKQTKTLKRELSGDELWWAFASKITPLDQQTQDRPKKKSDTYPVTEALINLKRKIKELSGFETRQIFVEEPMFSHNAAVKPDRQSTRKMRRGKVEIQAKLDLQGMTQTEAYKLLIMFLERSYLSERKTILVITGKGLTQNGKVGVLREVVPRWLNERPMKSWIRGFDFAAPIDGGEGALYVLIRRKR